MTIVTGVSDHYASAELVTLSAAEGGPIILDRRRVQSIDPELPAAPYHHEGLAVPIEKAEPIILRARHSVLAHARSALTELADALGVEAVVIQESPYEALPESVAEILASRPLACAADGMLYREALASQARAIGLTVHRFPRKSDQVAVAGRALGWTRERVETLLEGFGRTVGAPWRKEHRQVAAAALRVLAASAGIGG